MTVGEFPLRTAERTAEVEPSSRTEAGERVVKWRNASSNASRVPEPFSRITNGVVTNSSIATNSVEAQG